MANMLNITPQSPVAYFCAEYGLEAHLPLYAGGLGILAGDTIKAASDLNLPFVGIGLLYRGERMVQKINDDGMQIEEDWQFDPLEAGLEHVYIDDQPLFIRIYLTEIDIWCRVWKKTLSERVVLYLLDTDTDQNQMSERGITHPLYSGTEGTQLKQQLILGIGGVKLLHSLGIHPAVYHLNEGRPAFMHWQLVREFMEDHGMSFEQARQLAKEKTVYTNHTLVPAGNNSINCDFLKRYAQHYAGKMGVAVEQLLDDGYEQGYENCFYMTRFALNVSRKASGVSQLHSKLSAEIWPGYNWTNITNGVHLPTWQDPAIASANLDNDDLWHLHWQNKQALADFVFAQTGFSYPADRLVVTWARRLAGYKRLKDIFADVERLRQILRHADRPVQLLVAGKAHIQDKDGKIMLQEIIKFMAKELSGHALFIPNYNIDIAKMLAKGSDIWLNIPEQGQEACGTSGMKAISNGVLQCTVPDGWTSEVDWTGKGWTLQNEGVSNDFYQKMEQEIVPLFYDRDQAGVPRNWLNMMKESVKLAQQFSADRMLREYVEKLYG